MSEWSPADMLDLPLVQRRIMRLMLRRREILYGDLLVELATQSVEEHLSRLEIDVNLRELVTQGWLVREESLAQVTFRLGELSRANTAKQAPEPSSHSSAPITKSASRHSSGRERLSNFWKAVDETATEQPSRPKVNIRSGLAAEFASPAEESPSEPPRPRVVGKLFEELSAELPETDSDEDK